MATAAAFLAELQRILGPGGLLVDAAARRVYARDASHFTAGAPLAVALPARASDVAAVVAACARHGVPLTCRGGGTGLSGGALPVDGGLVLSLARLVAIGDIDAAAARVRCEAGVANAEVSRRARSAGLHFAPDPSSQAAATVGGNVAENAGGPHCLKHGVTLQHLLDLEWVDAAGRRWRTGNGAAVQRGIDLRPLLCGSEGTLGVVTAADLRLTPEPAAFGTLLAFFPSLAEGGESVVRLFAAGLLPIALEMIDRAMLDVLAEAFTFVAPGDAASALIVEFGGEPEEVAEDVERSAALLRAGGAVEIRTAADPASRTELWLYRKKAFGAVGRLAPTYISMDVVVPLGSLPAMVADIDAIRREHRVRIATAFHAGDGNLHPGIMHDDRDPDETRRAEAAAGAILRAALARRGSITGEHGVGLEKRHALPWQLDAESGRLLRAIKGVFDPAGLLNPGKLLPPAESVWAEPPPEPAAIAVDPASLIVSAPAAATVAAVQQAALAHGLWLPVGLWLERSDGPPGLGRAGTVGELVEQGVVGPGLVGARDPRECLLEVWAETGDGRRFHAGAPVAKNVAGYDLTHLLCGTAGLLGRIRAATFQLRPVPERLLVKQYAPAVGSPVAWDALHPVLAELTAGQNSDLAAPLLIAEGDARGVTGPVVVIVAGRDRAWDLGRREERLDEIASGIGPCARRRELAFTAAAELLARGKPGSVAGSVAAGRGSSTAAAEGERPGDIVPDWALTGSDWTLLQPTAAAPGGGVRLPEGLGSRLIWQAWPRAIWTPHGDLPTPAGWVPDPLWRAGRLQPPPSPPPSVPLALLARLQQLFDPDGNLARPDWLADAADSAAALAGPGGAA